MAETPPGRCSAERIPEKYLAGGPPARFLAEDPHVKLTAGAGKLSLSELPIQNNKRLRLS